MSKRPLVLASASASRAALLRGAGFEFARIPADLDEDAIKDDGLARGLNPKAVAIQLAEAKALHVSARHPGMVIGGDQVLQLDRDLISKSKTMDEARDLLRRMSGKIHYLHAGMALAENGQLLWSNAETAEMSVRPLSEDFIDGYLNRAGDQILSSVGCYQLESDGVHLFDTIRGDYFTVLGLPLLPLLARLRHYGMSPA